MENTTITIQSVAIADTDEYTAGLEAGEELTIESLVG